MKLTTLIENTAINKEYKPQHGLSIYIETQNHKILVDVGADGTFLDNAKKLGIDISAVDTLIITHGHSDHGGGLAYFLDANKKAKVYIQSEAFGNHRAKVLGGIIKANISLDQKLKDNPQIVFVDGDMRVDDELFIITNPKGQKFQPTFNKFLLREQDGKFDRDTFDHEQSVLIIENGKTVLIGGCAHHGILNILEDAEKKHGTVDICISGFHLYNPIPPFKSTEREEVLAGLAVELGKRKTKFYSGHCTGIKAFKYLQGNMKNLEYFATGQIIEV